MSDRNPKSIAKQASQKQEKSKRENRQKQDTITAKRAGSSTKQ